MRFSDDFIQRVRDSNNIVDIIGQYVQLNRSGASFRGLCPFPGHSEKTPSFFVSEPKQVFHCFGCKAKGDIFGFLKEYQGLSFPEAVEFLASRAGISLPEPEKNAQYQKNAQDADAQRKTLLQVNKYVGTYFQKKLKSAPATHAVQKYLLTRALSDKVVEEFKLGYASEGWSDLTNTLKRAKAPVDAAEKLGLIKRKQGGDFFDLFRDRLMFPIISATGSIVGFGGRSLGDQMPKYINSSESPIFSKGKTLYGLHATAKYIRAENGAFIVEGYMDLLALYQFGIKNVVATLGTAFTLEHAKALKRLCTHVTALFDGDEAGQLAADKSLPLLLEAGLYAKCLTLPDKADPDDFLRAKGVEEFKKLATKAPEHFIQYLEKQFDGYRGQPSEKVEILNKIGPILERVTDQRLRILYLQTVADRLSVDIPFVAQQLRSMTAQPTGNIEKNQPSSVQSKIPNEEEILVQFMLQKSEHLEQIRLSGAIDKFTNEEARMIARKIAEKYCQNPNDFDRLAASLIGEGITSDLLTSHIAFNSGLDKTGELQLIKDCLVRVNSRHLKAVSKQLLNTLKNQTDSTPEQIENFMKIAVEQKGPKSPSQN